ncbi:hypothetical protein [Kribbella ginsengisoli]|uniref:Flavin-dependent dehydrogenase n=1 Tax=Kribbella ginsengisoli TaxID=363865 RepID=A0ABP6YDX8_9ACTN
MNSLPVVVLGAGPAGAVAAAELARRGLRTILVGPPPTATHTLLVSRYAANLVADLVPDLLAAGTPINRLDVSFGTRPHLVIYDDSDLTAISYRDLTNRLLATAIAHGVDHRPTAPDLAASHQVVATGAKPAGAAGTGFVVSRSYNLPPTSARLHLSPPDAADPHGPPLVVRVVGTTISVTRLAGSAPPDAEQLLTRALDELADLDPAFAGALPDGPATISGASSAFAPESAADGHRLYVGDAAGLVNPFTGEGIGHALRSGLLAAEAIADSDDAEAAAAAYKAALRSSFVGYFETARHAARRYHLAWRVLADTAGSGSSFFAKGRRAVLMPDGIAGLAGHERIDLRPTDELTVAPFLAAASDIAVGAVRGEWPFIASLIAAEHRNRPSDARPALLFAGALMSAGRPPDLRRAELAAAVELAVLGSLALVGPLSTTPLDRGVDWQTATSVLAADFLMARAAELVARHEPQYSWAFSDWLGELSSVRARVWTDAASPLELFAAMFEFPARIGAEVGGASDEQVRAIRRFGRYCGELFVLSEDLRGLAGHPTRLEIGLDDARRAKMSTRLEEAALRSTSASSLEAAEAALEEVADGPGRRVLAGFARLLAR